MELYQLRTFATVAEEGHLTRAAERLHISQPAVSAQIKALETEFDARLFERISSGMVLTAAGAVLFKHAQKTLAAADRLVQAARAMKGEIVGRLRVGTSGDPAVIRLGELLGRAVQRYPQLDLELRHEMSGNALESVRDGRLDVSFYFGKIVAPGVTGIALGELVYRVAAPGAWCDRVRDADWTAIVAMPWITTPAISTHRQLVSELFAEHGGQPLVHKVEADNESVIDALVSSGVGLSLMLESIALDKQRAGEICIWNKARLRTTLWFVYREERADDRLIGALLDVLREIWHP